MLAEQLNATMSFSSNAGNHLPSDAPATETRVCPGCKNIVMTEDGGVVVAFGQSFFHVDCFKCAKCNNKVTADTNLLLLSDGSPVCANCSYSCNVCGQPILDEAIMTGDDSYHAHCFNCRVCKKRIDELVFAKTSQGIYCMDCHNERVARSRRHQQRKEKERARERAVAAVDTGSVKSKDGAATGEGNSMAPLSNSSLHTPRSGEQLSLNSLRRDSASSIGEKPPRSDSPARMAQTMSLPQPSHSESLPIYPSSFTPPPISPPSPRYSTLGALPTSTHGPLPWAPQNTPNAGSSSTPPSSADHSRTITSPLRIDSLGVPDRCKTIQKRRSYDDRPLNVILKEGPGDPQAQMSGLAVPNGGTSRSEKRRSINPAVALSFTASEPLTFNHSPTSASFSSSASSPRSETPPLQARLPSPLREHFTASQLALPNLNTDISPPPYSLLAGSDNDQGTSYGRARSASSSAYPDQSTPRPTHTADILDRVPARTTSRLDRSVHQESGLPGCTPAFPEGSRKYPDGRLSPSPGNGASGLRLQKSFDDRLRVGSSPRNSPSSLTFGQTIELPPRADSSRPTSPAHRVDVPHSIESGTDTEGEADEEGPFVQGSASSEDLPPLLPPKEGKGVKAGTRPPELTLTTSQADIDDISVMEGDDHEGSVEASPESSPVEQTSHATFIAPALPPIRFSMSGADFSELLKNVDTPDGQPPTTKSRRGGSVASGPSLTVDTTAQPASSTLSVSTPTSDITIVASDDMHSLEGVPIRSRSSLTTSYAGSSSPGPSEISDAPRPSLDSARAQTPASSRPSLDGYSPAQYEQNDSIPQDRSVDSVQFAPSHIRVIPSEPERGGRPEVSGELIKRRLMEGSAQAQARGVSHIKLNFEFVNAIVSLLDHQKEEYGDLKRKLDGMKRASQQYMDGLTVAQAEYDQELKARREAEAEVTRLRVLLSGQAARLTVISGETKRSEVQQKLSREMSDNLSTLERNLSKLKVERDMALAEFEELSASKSTGSAPEGMDTTKLGRGLSVRFDNIKSQYARQLLPLTQQREALLREIEDLRATREAFLEESTVLSARNEELAQLNAQYVRRVEATAQDQTSESSHDGVSADRVRSVSSISSSLSSATAVFSEESIDSRIIKIHRPEASDAPTPHVKASKFMKWPGSKTQKEHVTQTQVTLLPDANKSRARFEHSFQQVSMLRVARCDHCGDKMWGSQLRCNRCNISVHIRCAHHIHLQCTQQPVNGREEPPPHPSAPASSVPSMFGRDLATQIRTDSKDGQRLVPIIVEKCIDAVDFLGLDYEGIYRKTGGSRLCKIITQLFERGDYNAFDLRDPEEFNDICSITSVLKTYFRSLPDPLLTFALHDKFIEASVIREAALRNETVRNIVAELPKEHYHTTKALMMHLHRVAGKSEVNLMHARNLGVVFGPTLMRSRDPNMEFSDMAGKALSVEWLVENAPAIFESSA